MAGRPSKFTDVLAEQICERLANGEALINICKAGTMPSTTAVYRWLEDNPEFRDKYARARERQADYYAAQIIEIADTCREGKKIKETKDGTFTEIGDMVERSRLMVDARKWYASKLAPKKYGDSASLKVGGDPDGVPIQAAITVQFVKTGADGNS